MRCAIAALMITFFVCATATAQESFPATHLARLDIVDPNPNAGTIGGVAIIAVDPTTGVAQARITAAPAGDMPDTLFVLYRTGTAGDLILARIPFPPSSSTLTTSLPIFTTTMLSAVDSGVIWLAVHKRSDHTPYVDGPLQSVPSALTPEPSGAEVVPPVDGTDGVAHCGLAFDPATKDIRYTAWWLDLTGNATAARIRRAAPGSNGPIVFEMPLTSGSDQSIGVWEKPSAELREAIVKGELYFEVTTSTFQNGELRGQIYPVEGFTSAIEPSNEVPAVTGSTASGSAYLLITAHGTREVFNKLQGVIGNLSGPMTAAHIHRGAIGQSGDPVVTLERSGTGIIDLELAAGSAGGAMSNEIVSDIRATRSYVNVHTAAHDGGEARGELIPARGNLTATTSSVPTTATGHADFSAYYDRQNQTVVVSIDDKEDERRIVIYAADGRVVQSTTCEGTRCELSTVGLAAGLYFVRLESEGSQIGGARSVMVMP